MTRDGSFLESACFSSQLVHRVNFFLCHECLLVSGRVRKNPAEDQKIILYLTMCDTKRKVTVDKSIRIIYRAISNYKSVGRINIGVQQSKGHLLRKDKETFFEEVGRWMKRYKDRIHEK